MKLIKLALIFSLLLMLHACKHEDLQIYQENKNYRNAADFVQNNYDLTLFYAAIQQAGLVETLRGEGPFTVFAPNNAAFNDLGITKAADFAKMNKDSLKFMLQYHILPRRLYSDNVPANTVDNRYLNLADKKLYIAYNKRANRLYINGASASPQNVILANGVLHVLNKVIKYNPGTVKDILNGRPEYSLFVAGLKQFGYWEQLGELGPYTLIAPSNDAFIAAGISLQDILAMNPVDYKKRLFGCYIFKNHLFHSDLDVFGEPEGSGYYSNEGAYFRIPVNGDEEFSSGVGRTTGLVFTINTYPLSGTVALKTTPFAAEYQLDYLSENGLVHRINELLVLPAQAKK
eukprot:gene2873-3299_t